MTNVFGSGVPADALDGVYSLMSWYYDMTGFKDAEVVKAADDFNRKFRKEYGYPPTRTARWRTSERSRRSAGSLWRSRPILPPFRRR